jgi:hypothetical protein
MAAEIETPLSLLKEALEDLEYTVYHERAGGDNLVEKLFISLEIEEQPPQRQFVIELLFINDVLHAFGGDDDDDDAIMSQFTLVLPIVVPTAVFTEINRFCSIVNRLAPLGAFGLSEADQAVYLRYCLASESREMPDSLVIQVVSVFEFLCREYAKLFAAICDGSDTTDAFIKSFARTGNAIPSVGNPLLLSGAKG